ncbi:Signal transduction histidine kinase [Butyrivibrio sp. ob235]|uniref:ATP-binding protein n=1 Tax=Butyrivibrio sp. ob235 TaxID=1761780 RepID=UPI0008D08206|nr:ATP-binding protein [Butyrivibrio sp. ob235]SEK36880.1 Signal transduction histidine kinase [Butyrivibrio sp. ob235]
MLRETIADFRNDEEKYFEICEKNIVKINMTVQRKMSIALVGIYLIMLIVAKALLQGFRLHVTYYILFIILFLFFVSNQQLKNRALSLRLCRLESIFFYGLLYVMLIVIDILPYKEQPAGLFPFFLIMFSTIYIDKLRVYFAFDLSLCIGFAVFCYFWKSRLYFSRDIFAIIASMFVTAICTLILVNLRMKEALNNARLEELRFKAAEAEANAIAANGAKTQFLSQMSHEIRTPINAIIGMNELILREYDDNQLKKYAHNIKSASNTLLTLINDVLDFSKIEAGKMELYNVEYDLADMISELVNMVEERAKNKGLEFNTIVNSQIPHLLYGDNVRLKQVILNILTNAVKYTEHGSIEFAVDYIDGGHLDKDSSIGLKISVSDTGIGIREEDMHRLYDPFERLEETRNRNIEGSGLGMSIVQKFLKLMNSELYVKSEYGKGSTFSFVVEQQIRSFEPIGDFKVAYDKIIEDDSNYRELFTAPDADILVVDDNEINLVVTRNLLKDTMINIETASSGKEALLMTAKKKYDLMLIDHRMPEMDGMEMLWRLKSDEKNINRDTPSIALTANAFSGARDVYRKSGFQDYLSKPIIGDALEKMLINYLPEDKVYKNDNDLKKKKKPQKYSKTGERGESKITNIEELREDYFDDKELYEAIGIMMERANIQK